MRIAVKRRDIEAAYRRGACVRFSRYEERLPCSLPARQSGRVDQTDLARKGRDEVMVERLVVVLDRADRRCSRSLAKGCQVRRVVRYVNHPVRDDGAFPMNAADRSAPKRPAGEGIERAQRPAARVIQDVASNKGRKAALASLPLRDERRIARAVDAQLQTGDSAIVDDVHPRCAVDGIDPDSRLSKKRSALRQAGNRADLASQKAGPAPAAQIREIEEPQLAVLAALRGEMRNARRRRHR